MKRSLVLIIGMAFLLVSAGILLAEQSSDNYEIPLDVISGGGSPSSSTGYLNNGSLGQPAPLGGATTTSYANYPGFWQAHECLFDPDADLLSDCVEWYLGTIPNNPDSDGDGLNDGAEVLTYLTDPLLPDSDGDGLQDGEEVNTYLTDPLKADTDGDGVSDGAEALTYGTNPKNPDTDGDLLGDGFEIDYPLCLDPLAPNAAFDANDTDPLAHIHEFYNNNGAGNVSHPCDKEKPRRGWAKNLISLILNGKLSGIIAGSPTELSLVAPIGGATVAEGDTVRIQVKLTGDDGDKPRAGVGGVFTIVSGAGTLLGGEGGSEERRVGKECRS